MPETAAPIFSSSPSSPSSLPADERYVFVYGTLRRGDRNDITQLQPAPRFVGYASVKGVMHHLGAYPGVLLLQGDEGASRVLGEVYAIQPALERTLDGIEMIGPGPDDEYFKRELPVLVDGRTLTCLVYEINPRFTEGCPVIGSGDWVRDSGV